MYIVFFVRYIQLLSPGAKWKDISYTEPTFIQTRHFLSEFGTYFVHPHVAPDIPSQPRTSQYAVASHLAHLVHHPLDVTNGMIPIAFSMRRPSFSQQLSCKREESFSSTTTAGMRASRGLSSSMCEDRATSSSSKSCVHLKPIARVESEVDGEVLE
jgi:hypothetical protein